MTGILYRLPFLTMPGTLYAAPLGAETPDLAVKRRRFVEDWPDSWIKLGETDPRRCKERVVETERITVGGPLHLTGGPSEPRHWTFGLSAVNTREAAPYFTLMSSVRVMFGWESEEERARVVAWQARGEEVSFRRAVEVWPIDCELEQDNQGRLFDVFLADPES